MSYNASCQPSQTTSVNQAIAEFQRAPGYGCLNMGGCQDRQSSRPRQAKNKVRRRRDYARRRFREPLFSSSSWRDGGTARLSCENLSQRALVVIMVHGAIVYARHNAAEKDQGDAMADEEEG